MGKKLAVVFRFILAWGLLGVGIVALVLGGIFLGALIFNGHEFGILVGWFVGVFSAVGLALGVSQVSSRKCYCQCHRTRDNN